ncbi:MAG: hypothetical protein LQ346_004216 [Caloplaca aetnensis]|nr:MAG: hypothetical protein LQ346_004216 [Caloplaca aetnensis]
MPFHMTRSSLGLHFTNYDVGILSVPNEIINQVLAQAIRDVGAKLARDPGLGDRPVQDEYLKWTHPIDEIALFIEPTPPNMTFGNMYAVFHLLRVWAQEYKAEQCSFVIWAWPGTERQKRLGQGHFLLDPDPPLKSESRS